MKRTFHPKTNIFFCIAVCSLLHGFFSFVNGAEPPVYQARLEEVFTSNKFKDIQAAAKSEGVYYLLESANHRLLAVEDNGVSGQIGRIGQNAGEFYYPRDFEICRDHHFVVLDLIGSGLNRVQALDSKGRQLWGFTCREKVWGFAVSPEEKIFLGQTGTGRLISVYDAGGDKVGSFGELIKPSSIYGKKYASADKTYETAMNRVNIACAEEGNIWVSFLFMPVLIKYNPKGEILYKKRINFPGLDSLEKAIWNPGSEEARQYLSMNLDGIQMAVVIKDLTYCPSSENVYLLLGNNQILVLNRSGETRYIIKPVFKKGVLEKMFVVGRDEIIVKFFFHHKLYKLNFDRSAGKSVGGKNNE